VATPDGQLATVPRDREVKPGTVRAADQGL
jgi:hypothetical protein